ncbi:MAG: response regulator [Actinomycetota bacterium]|nr:response regulator [Actinomycetota bacterium]MDP9460312.1 response regulator [Actinomycetota bacterium]
MTRPSSLPSALAGKGAVRPQILVVDDDAFIRQLVVDVLELEGYEVHEAVDGAAGILAYDALRPDCVVLDVMMPGLDGFEVLRRIRAADEMPVPVVMLTAAGAESASRSWRGGADFFLRKPFEPDQLVGVLESLLVDTPPA